MPRITALVVAAGKGTRFGGDIPKQWLDLDGRILLRHCLGAFSAHPEINDVHVVINPSDRNYYQIAASGLSLAPFIAGGATRQDSVRLGLEAIAHLAPDYVLIHDGARPFIDKELINRITSALSQDNGVLPVMTVVDTLKFGTDGMVGHTIPRENLYRAQTPQAFPFAPLLEAHRQYIGLELTDDAAIAEKAGIPIRMVPGAEYNVKITSHDDWQKAAAWRRITPSETRIGNGFDVHRFKPGTSVTLCNVSVPHDFSLEGHSDADVAIHAVTDALLGAISAGDIGRIFPPTDERWNGANSAIFLSHSRALVEAIGAKIIHIDLTIICESPKIGPYRSQMESRMAQILDISPDRISIKATTTEKLGFTGRREGIAAQATASVAVKPLSLC